MQQQISQSDPIGGQGIPQQMVLCPVRLVYETQVLMQPGEQIQPNQTFFINPQNPPPWAHNRPQPNPVVYVQQLPNNMVPQVQQHMDQNQLYLQQNYANFQLQQPMLAQNEMRQMQIASIMPNMVQQNVPNDRSIQNGQIQANNNMIQNQMNLANTRQVANQQMSQVDVQRQMFMNMRPQISHQVNIARPVMAINQMQNMQTLANMQNVQIQQPNVGQPVFQNIAQRPPNNQNVNTIRPKTVPNNVINVQPQAKVREIAPSEPNKMNTAVGTTVPVRNFSQNYNCRPIQPRRRYVQNNATVPNAVTKAQNHNINVQTLPQGYSADKTPQTVTNVATNTNFINPNLNRKRKSESPDEIQKKMAIQPNLQPNLVPQQGITVTKVCNEIGTNTSPVHKPTSNINNINNINTNDAFQNNSNTPMITVQSASEMDNMGSKITEQNLSSLSEKDKLVRNTVYTQARGRLLQDKISETIKPQENLENMNVAVNIVNTEVQTVSNPENTEKVAIQTETQVEKAVMADLPKPASVIPDKSVIPENKTQEEKVPEQSKVVEENSVNSEAKNNEKESEKIVLNKDKDFILTHVVDGYVIQESNFAFPIRKPLKEKTLYTNHKQESMDALKECMKEEMKSNVDIPHLPFHYLLLNCDKKEEKEEVIEDKKKNPFDKLQHTTVKKWTVDDLSQHLLKFDWKDTVSVLQDNEIDGDALFLVSKTQLLNIGVAEEHTETILEFVRS